MKIAISVASIFLLSTNGNGFIVHKNQPHRLARQQMSSTEESEVDVGYTPELKKVTDAFARITDEQLRYKQLLYMAQNTKEVNNMPESLKVPENKVPGCLSTVYVDGTARLDEETGDYLIDFIGDSDGLLTRGLVALLIRYVFLVSNCSFFCPLDPKNGQKNKNTWNLTFTMKWGVRTYTFVLDFFVPSFYRCKTILSV